jgi:SMC interacting uncharacterized protein involved in chromosome segregation
MKTSRAIALTSNLALAAALAVLVGCKSGNYEKAGSTSTGLTDAATRIDLAKGKVDVAVSSLNDLVNNPSGDLVPRFKKFTAAVSDLESSAKDVNSKVSGMKGAGNEYFKAWDEQVAQIHNEDIKNRSAARKSEMQERFTNIKKTYIETGDAFKPFMSDLKDIQTALSTDLTPGGIAAVKPAADKANKESVAVKAAADKLAAQFKELGVAMSSASGAAPAPAPAK